MINYLTGTQETNINRMKLLYTLLDDMGNLIHHIGQVEQETNERGFLQGFSKNTIGIMNQLSDTLTSEELGDFMKLMIKLAGHESNLSNFLELSAEDKISVGTEIKKLADATKTLISSIEKKRS